MFARASAFLLLAACWTSSGKPSTVTENKPPSKPTEPERRALLRIDEAPSGKRFQGVWLEFPDDKRWVIDYRVHGIWQAFEDAAVLVTGECYTPPAEAQSINAQHFRVHRMRFATPEPRGVRPYIEIGP